VKKADERIMSNIDPQTVSSFGDEWFPN
jgi:hypothetical protein